MQHSNQCWNSTVYPKKYAHGFCFPVLCCGYTLTDFPISIRLTSLALWQSNDCPIASKATQMNMDKYFMWIHYGRLHNHNKAKHNKTVCIFLGIYCIYGIKHTFEALCWLILHSSWFALSCIAFTDFHKLNVDSLKPSSTEKAALRCCTSSSFWLPSFTAIPVFLKLSLTSWHSFLSTAAALLIELWDGSFLTSLTSVVEIICVWIFVAFSFLVSSIDDFCRFSLACLTFSLSPLPVVIFWRLIWEVLTFPFSSKLELTSFKPALEPCQSLSSIAAPVFLRFILESCKLSFSPTAIMVIVFCVFWRLACDVRIFAFSAKLDVTSFKPLLEIYLSLSSTIAPVFLRSILESRRFSFPPTVVMVVVMVTLVSLAFSLSSTVTEDWKTVANVEVRSIPVRK